MLALIDGDIITHRVGFTTENESSKIAQYRADEMLDQILLDTGANEFRVYLSDSKENNFRYKIDPSYKANRVAPKPKHYDFLKEHLLKEWGAMISYGMEADDSLGINQDKIGNGELDDAEVETWGTVICSIDKDLLQIPGLNYNFVKKEFSMVGKEEGFLSFYRSIMVGDVADNIKGIYGIGPKKAEKILPKWVSEEDAIKKVYQAYYEWFDKAKGDVSLVPDIIRKNAQLLKIKQTENEKLWDSVFLKQMEEQIVSYTPPAEVVLNPSTEPTIQVSQASAG